MPHRCKKCSDILKVTSVGGCERHVIFHIITELSTKISRSAVFASCIAGILKVCFLVAHLIWGRIVDTVVFILMFLLGRTVDMVVFILMFLLQMSSCGKVWEI